MDDHKVFIRRCFSLAANGLGTSSPNPLVGSVIVHDGHIIGEGFHYKAGGPHAEVVAVNSVSDKSLLPTSTLYVNLEPCCHTGLTPPCSELIIQHKIPKVIVSNRDPNPKVAGGGVQMLREHGVEVIEGILTEQGQELNRRFFTLQNDQRPYVILKWAQSSDGFIDVARSPEQHGIHWISSPDTQKLVHLWRAQEDAILVGTQTVINDNPSLTVREVQGENPLRIVIDRNLVLSNDRKIFDDSASTLVFHGPESKPDNKANGKTEYTTIPFENSCLELLTELGRRQITSVIIEGGRKTLQSFIDSGLWDEARIITGKNPIEKGLKSPEISGISVQKDTFASDKIEILRRK